MVTAEQQPSPQSKLLQRFACFNFGKIQNIINDREESIGAAANGLSELALLSVRSQAIILSFQQHYSWVCGFYGSCWRETRSWLRLLLQQIPRHASILGHSVELPHLNFGIHAIKCH
jgi:hypothetical protein